MPVKHNLSSWLRRERSGDGAARAITSQVAERRMRGRIPRLQYCLATDARGRFATNSSHSPTQEGRVRLPAGEAAMKLEPVDVWRHPSRQLLVAYGDPDWQRHRAAVVKCVATDGVQQSIRLRCRRRPDGVVALSNPRCVPEAGGQNTPRLPPVSRTRPMRRPHNHDTSNPNALRQRATPKRTTTRYADGDGQGPPPNAHPLERRRGAKGGARDAGGCAASAHTPPRLDQKDA